MVFLIAWVLAIEYVKNCDFQPAIRSMAMETVCSGSIFFGKNKRGAWGAKPPIFGIKNIIVCIVSYGFMVLYGMLW